MGDMFSSIFNVMMFAFVVFVFVLWLWLLFAVIGDLFRRHDIGGVGKVLWILFLILLPRPGVFLYILTRGRGMGERQVEQARRAQANLRAFIGFSPADEDARLRAKLLA